MHCLLFSQMTTAMVVHLIVYQSLDFWDMAMQGFVLSNGWEEAHLVKLTACCVLWEVIVPFPGLYENPSQYRSVLWLLTVAWSSRLPKKWHSRSLDGSARNQPSVELPQACQWNKMSTLKKILWDTVTLIAYFFYRAPLPKITTQTKSIPPAPFFLFLPCCWNLAIVGRTTPTGSTNISLYLDCIGPVYHQFRSKKLVGHWIWKKSKKSIPNQIPGPI